MRILALVEVLCRRAGSLLVLLFVVVHNDLSEDIQLVPHQFKLGVVEIAGRPNDFSTSIDREQRVTHGIGASSTCALDSGSLCRVGLISLVRLLVLAFPVARVSLVGLAVACAVPRKLERQPLGKACRFAFVGGNGDALIVVFVQ